MRAPTDTLEWLMGNNTKARIIRYIFESSAKGEPIWFRGIFRGDGTGRSVSSAQRELHALRCMGLVTVRRERFVSYLELDETHPLFEPITALLGACGECDCTPWMQVWRKTRRPE